MSREDGFRKDGLCERCHSAPCLCGLTERMRQAQIPTLEDQSATILTPLEHLNHRVTGAILAAEQLTEGSPEANAAWNAVSLLEEQIAERTSVLDLEGEIARCGAVMAAHSAGDTQRARRLGEIYLAQGPSSTIANKLRQLIGGLE